jgi:hypothetical protein
MSAPDVTIQPVTDEEAGELLTLRRAAFVSEAQVYGDPNIPRSPRRWRSCAPTCANGWPG